MKNLVELLESMWNRCLAIGYFNLLAMFLLRQALFICDPEQYSRRGFIRVFIHSEQSKIALPGAISIEISADDVVIRARVIELSGFHKLGVGRVHSATNTTEAFTAET
jgi:hypothetical protein